MLHRMALRVLPSLSQAVTTAEVRRRKRIVMLVPGLVAFVLYRAAKQLTAISDIWVLLALSGLISALTAVAAYRAGRGVSVQAMWKEDGIARMGWLVGWIGLAYGVQLSLMVLALLKVVVHYDFLLHPDGPAMMAIIIACTSVARDAFEIGHIRRLQRAGEPIVTFPDGSALRVWLVSHMPSTMQPVLVAAAIAVLLSMIAAALGSAAASSLGQLLIVSAVSGTLALFAYLLSKQPERAWGAVLRNIGWTELFRFWWWPGVAFAATYYLTLQGIFLFMAGAELGARTLQILMAGSVAAGMTLYCSYLGHRRAVEDRLHQTIPRSLLRCPFVLGLLSKGSETSSLRGHSYPDTESVAPEPLMVREGRQGS
jgi:hypothetical protein